MIRTVIALAVAAFFLAAVPAPSNAAPIAPLPAGVASDVNGGQVTKVWWHRWHHWHHWHWHRWHCWRWRHCW